MKTNEIKVSKIEIDIRGKKLELTPEELKELKAVLDDALPTKVVVRKETGVVHVPSYIPWLYYERPRPYWGGWEVTCKSEGTMSLCVKP